MSWARLDDRYANNRKIRKAWKRERGAVAMHCLSITYCAQNELDGIVDAEWVEDMLPNAKERERIAGTLLELGLWAPHADGYEINDYLEFNPSKAQLEAKRAKERARRAERDGVAA